MNMEPGKTARRRGTLIPNPNAKLRDQFHEVREAEGRGRRADACPAGRKTEWPKSLADRVKAVETARHAGGVPATPAALAKQLKRAKPADVVEILKTLVTVGRAHRKGNQFTR